jgi:predicted Zn-dependent protease
MRYRRVDELEADREGMLLLQRARIDPAGMVSFMRTLDAQESGTPRVVSYLSTHPQTADRVTRLEELARDGTFPAEPVMSPEDWAAARAVCEAVPGD